MLIITDEPSGMRSSTRSRAASRSSTTSTLNPRASRARTVSASVPSSGSAVNRSDVWIAVLMAWLLWFVGRIDAWPMTDCTDKTRQPPPP